MSKPKGQTQRRPRGVYYVITDDIVKRLIELLARPGMTTEKLSDAYRERFHYYPHPSAWTKIKNRSDGGSSRLVYNLAEMYDWPRPPIASADPQAADFTARAQELKSRNPDMFAAIDGTLDEYLSVARDVDRIKKSGPTGRGRGGAKE